MPSRPSSSFCSSLSSSLSSSFLNRFGSLTPSFLLSGLATLAIAGAASADFYTHIVQIGPGGADTSIDSVAEAQSLLDGGFAPYQILVDKTALRSTIDLGTEGDYAVDSTYPDGTSGDSFGGPFLKEQFTVRAQATLTIPAGNWTIAFGSDEGGRLILPGITFTSELNTLGDGVLDDTITYDGTRTHLQTLGQFTLAAPAVVDLDAFCQGQYRVKPSAEPPTPSTAADRRQTQ